MSAEWVLTLGAAWPLSIILICRIVLCLDREGRRQAAGVGVVLRGIDIDREAEAQEREMAA